MRSLAKLLRVSIIDLLNNDVLRRRSEKVGREVILVVHRNAMKSVGGAGSCQAILCPRNISKFQDVNTQKCLEVDRVTPTTEAVRRFALYW